MVAVKDLVISLIIKIHMEIDLFYKNRLLTTYYLNFSIGVLLALKKYDVLILYPYL